jgi:hypothetical protein
MSSYMTDIRPMPTLLRLSLPLSTDFGNAEPSTQGLSCTQASDIDAPSAENIDFVGIKTYLSLGF